MAEVEDHVKRITQRKGVKGLIILDSQGVPIRDTFDESSRVLTIQYAHLISLFVEKARTTIRKLDPTNELQMLRLRSRKHEIIVAPGPVMLLMGVVGMCCRTPLCCYLSTSDRDYTLIAIQEPDCS